MSAADTWIKVYRKMTEWEWYQDSHMVHIFLHLLLRASTKDTKWKGIDVKRGQVITGRKALSESTGITEQTIRTCLNRLKSTSEITIKSTSKYSIITLCNYDKYNSPENQTNQQINQQTNQQTNQQLTSNQPATNHIQEVKEVKNKRIKDIGVKFTPPSLEEVTAYCQERRNTVNPQKWFSHYESNGWLVGKAKMKDWKASVRYWETSDKQSKPQRQAARRPVSLKEQQALELLGVNSHVEP